MKLKDLRKKYDITQEELAKRLNISQMAISHYEIGDRLPKPGKIYEMASLFGMKPGEIWELLTEKEAQNAGTEAVYRERGDSNDIGS